MNNKRKVSVLFVCMGNICRSPTAEGVFRHVVNEQNMSDQISIDSAGTHAYHIGEQPDSRSQSTARNHGVDLSNQRARKALSEDFDKFEYVIAMDRSNYENLKQICSAEQTAKLHLFMEFASDWDNPEVPDPYYGEGDGFERVFDMVQAASEGLLAHIMSNDLDV
ncbi:MAG: low molecular weight protein-tyrosine-phosphatase [Cocleimonas sp.]